MYVIKVGQAVALTEVCFEGVKLGMQPKEDDVCIEAGMGDIEDDNEEEQERDGPELVTGRFRVFECVVVC